MAKRVAGATELFSDRVRDYVLYRPGYPAELIDYLIEACDLDANDTIADIGSGTGIFSRLLLDRHLAVCAIEPNPEMRRASENLLSSHASIQFFAGTAEATMLASNSIDVVTVAQAFHWFDEDAALAEFKRILKPRGQLVLIWNRRDLSDPFQQAYEKMLLEMAPHYNAVNHMSIKDEQLEALFDSDSYQHTTFQYLQSFNCEQFLGRMQSSSYSPVKASRELSELRRAAVSLFEEFAENGRLEFLYCSHLYLGRPVFKP